MWVSISDINAALACLLMFSGFCLVFEIGCCLWPFIFWLTVTVMDNRFFRV